MPQPPNRVARILVPAVALLLAVGVAISFYVNTQKAKSGPSGGTAQPTAAPASPAVQPTPALTSAAAPTAAPAPGQAAAPATPAAPGGVVANPAPNLTSMKVKTWAKAEAPGGIGGLGPESKVRLEAKFSTLGAGISSLKLANYFGTIEDKEHVEIQAAYELQVKNPDGSIGGVALVPFAATAIRVQGVVLSLAGTASEPVWRSRSPGVFEAEVVDANDQPVLKLRRAYALAEDSFTITVRQSIENQTTTPLIVEWYQLGPVELSREGPAYGLDARYSRMGYQLSPALDPSRQVVLAAEHREQLASILGKPRADGTFADHTLWPTEDSKKREHTLVWAGTTNRYFAVAAFGLTDPKAPAQDKAFRWVNTIDRVVLNRGVGQEVFGLRMASTQQSVPAGGSVSLDFGFFSGPMDRKQIATDAVASHMGMDGLIVYNLGGMCGFCTFGWLTGLLRVVLGFLHDYIARDWAIAIMLLVLCVRTLLHPVTKWSQLKMGLMGKKMAAVGPKQKAIQEKYKNDPKKIQEETAKLWREEGVNPFGCVAIVPSFMQMPVWFALYALLFFAVELRHTPAFYGVFQNLFGGAGKTVWFLGDLSEPDRLVYFGRTLANLWFIGPISSINILPLALGIVFFLQQKYLTPPTTVTMTPEQEMQQKIIKWMTVIMFPLFMYNAPSGLSLYFFTNSTLAIIESRYIRSHLDKYEKQMEERRKAKPSAAGGGFFAKLLAAAEAKQREVEGAKSGQRPPRKKV